MILDVTEFLNLRGKLPLIDVRSESEFQQGHIADAHNIPLLNDSERVIVGTIYKQQGQKEAIKAGFRLVGPRLLEIINEAEKFGNEIIVHCWRGGMRSANFCQFVGMAGVKSHQIKGGYKAYRTLALKSFDIPFDFRILSGLTGSGKTELLKLLEKKGQQIIDLEALANHKGSVFGGLGMPDQPTTEQFQNDLFEVIRSLDPHRPVWVEDESIAIGKIFLPNNFWANLRTGKIVVLEVPKSVRVSRLVSEYENIAPEIFHEALKGIIKKLGGQNYHEAKQKLFADDLASAIEIILGYYDKAYTNAIERKKGLIKQKANWDGGSMEILAERLIIEETVSA